MSIDAAAIALHKGLTDVQYRAASLLALPKGTRPSREDIAKECGIHLATLYRWLQVREFDDVRRACSRAYFVDDVPDVIAATKNRALAGDMAAAKLFLDWAREMEPPVTDITIRVTLAKAAIEERLAALRRKVIDVVPEATGSPEPPPDAKTEPESYAPDSAQA
jgi:hypothetical protein